MQDAFDTSRQNPALLASLPLTHSFAPAFLDPNNPVSMQALSSLPPIALAGQWPQSANNILARYAQFADLQQQIQKDAAANLQPQIQPSRKKGAGQDSLEVGFAVRHKTAEKRRRARINDQLDELRKMVPHQASATRVTFLEDVVKYVAALQSRNAELEAAFSGLQEQLGISPQSIGRLGGAEASGSGLLLLAQKPGQHQQVGYAVGSMMEGAHKRGASTEQSGDWSSDNNSNGNSAD